MGSICSPEEEAKDTNTQEQGAPRRGGAKGREDSVPSGSRVNVDDSEVEDATTGMKIVVTPANGADGMNGAGLSDIDSPSASDPEPEEPKKKKIDSTLGGKISWKKVADFSALLPKDVKLKLWKGVFKTDSDYEAPEVKRISKVLRTFVMLQLTREYKKTSAAVPNELKTQLPGAVKEPSKFISNFLKQEEKTSTMEGIYESLKQRFQTEDETKKAKYAKKLEATEKNYNQLMMDPLKTDFNEEDFLKTAFLQYMLYAYNNQMDQ